ncbi:MAG: hypothetical protein Q8Q18_01940 [bacterium]|nr:hypothetical protein [bacterium]
MEHGSPLALFSRGVLLIDIGSHSIGAAYVTVRDGDLVLCGATRREFAKETLSDEIVRKRIISGLPQLLVDMHSRYGRSAGVVLCINGIFAISGSRSTDITLDKSTSVNNATLRPIIQSAITSFYKEVLGAEQNDFSPLDTSLLSTRINGYEVADPIGKIAKSVGVTVYVTATPISFLNDIKKAIGVEYHASEISAHTSTYALYRGMNDFFDSSDWLMVDATGGVTEFVFVENGTLSRVISIPFGGHDFVDRVASQSLRDSATIRADMALFYRNKLEGKRSAALRTAIVKTARGVAGDIIKALRKNTPAVLLPPHVAVVSHPWVAPLISAALEDPIYIRESLGAIAPEISPVDSKWLTDHGVYFEDGRADVFLGLLALGTSRFKSGSIML